MSDNNGSQLENPSTGFFEIPDELYGGGGWSIEVPPLDDAASFFDSAIEVLPAALDDCKSIKVLKAKKIVQFAPTIIRYDDTHNRKIVIAGGQGSFNHRNIFLITLALDGIRNAQIFYPHDHWKIHALGTVLHELFEMDDMLTPSRQHVRVQFGAPGYALSGHETSATERALSCLSSVYGNHFGYTNNTFHLVDR